MTGNNLNIPSLHTFAIVTIALAFFPISAPAVTDLSVIFNGKGKNNYQELVAKASVTNKIRIIVGLQLDFPYQLDAELSEDSKKAQRKAIVNSQARLFEKYPQYKNLISTKKFKYIPYIALEINVQHLEALYADLDVITIEEDIAVPPILQNSIPQVGANNVWSSGYTGLGQSIAILDTGIDKNHPFIAGKVISEACYSSNLCPNGQTSQIGPGAGINCSLSIPNCDHGTHVAGIAAGMGSFSGVAKDANLISIQVFSNFNNSLGANTSDIIRGLERVYELRGTYQIAAVNLSLGGGTYSSFCDGFSTATTVAISNLYSSGIATAIASGNNGTSNAVTWPACISKAVSVGSVSKADVVSNFSNSASFLSLLAPGESIYSSVPGGFGYKSGTSMAAPHVAGSWALLKSKWPYTPVKEALNSLQLTGKLVTDSRNGMTKQRIQVDQAIQNLSDWMLSDSDSDGMLNRDELTVGRNPYVNETSIITIINSILLNDD